MMATEATSENFAAPSITPDNELNTTETKSQDVTSEQVPTLNGITTDKDGSTQNSDLLESINNSAEVSVSGGSDTEATKTEASKNGDDKGGHLRSTSAVKRPTSFKAVSVNKTFLASKASTAAAPSKLGEKGPAASTSTPATLSASSSAQKPRLVAKSGSGLRDSTPRAANAANGGKPGGAPDASAVWNKNRPAPPPEPKRFTDEELKQRYGIHLATRLQSDDPGKQANWADIDDDDDDWAPESIEWTDGTKITLPQADEAHPPPPEPAPAPVPTPAPKEVKKVEPGPKPSPSPAPQPTASPIPKQSVFGSGRAGLVLKGASEKPTLVAKPPGPPTPVKSPWATLPPVEKVAPIAIEAPQAPPQQSQQGRFSQRDPHSFSGMPPPPAKEIAADDFSRTWRDGNAHGGRELYNSQSGRYEPVNEIRRGSSRTDGQSRGPAVLQRPAQHDVPAEPSAAFQTHRSNGPENTYGRRRTSSNVSGGSGNFGRRMSRGHDMPPPHDMLSARRGSLAAVSDAPSSPRNFSPSGQQFQNQRPYPGQPWQSRASPNISHPSPQSVHGQLTPGSSDIHMHGHGPPPQMAALSKEDPLEEQKNIMKRTRELAIKRRQEAEAKEEAERKERIRIKLEAMGPPPEKKKNKEESLKDEKSNSADDPARDVGPSTATKAEAIVEGHAHDPANVNDKVNRHTEGNAPVHESRPNGVYQPITSGSAAPAQQSLGDNRNSQSWQKNSASNTGTDRFTTWSAAPPPAQNTSRSGYLEETYFTGSFIPLRGDDCKVYGFYNTAYEITKQKLSDRRASMLNQLEIPSGVHEGTLAGYVIPPLETNPLDIPMAMLFQIDENDVSGSVVRLRGQIGVPENHPLAIKQADLSSCIGLYPLFCKAKKEIITLPVDERFAGIEWRGHKNGATGLCQPSSHFSVLPIATADRLYGFLVLGANAYRPIDDDHCRFMQNIAAKVSIIAASVASAEETKRRADRLEQELVEREKQIRYMAQYAPVGMQHLSSDGSIIWANEMYYQHTGHPKDAESQYNFSFLDVFIEEDRPKAMQSWADLLQGASHVEISLRIKRIYFPPTGEPEHACLLFLAFPYVVNGEIKSLMCCTTDISQLKWAEASEARNAADAREAKRQQEEFIDVVSHEMRNPLSAIFQCAEMISNSFRDLVHMSAVEILKSNIEAANTITMCATHQKHIVDDVLTLSKLKYMMLTISPRPVRPISIFEQVVKMFQADLTSHDISINTIVEPSFGENKIDWVMFDDSRVTQILINLLTNAIKFTKGESQRKITITYGAALTEPRDTFPKDLYWVPCEKKVEDLTLRPEWGNGEHVFLTCSVKDTGTGMKEEEIPRLFARFEQANSKTSIKYGGSGLGLFISQQLTEKQGGRIGLSSVLGKGSTFGFYVKARRNTAKVADSGSLSRRLLGYHRENNSASSTMHVLLVEDNLINQKILHKQLKRAGCIVHVANHGLEALEILRQSSCWHEPAKEAKQVDIILMDWEMPVMDGLTCSREIRKLQELGKIVRHIEIIATTANARDEQIESALHNGIDFVMAKPFAVSDLLSKMRERLSGVDDGIVYQ